jgi:hypothetical protein
MRFAKPLTNWRPFSTGVRYRQPIANCPQSSPAMPVRCTSASIISEIDLGVGSTEARPLIGAILAPDQSVLRRRERPSFTLLFDVDIKHQKITAPMKPAPSDTALEPTRRGFVRRPWAERRWRATSWRIQFDCRSYAAYDRRRDPGFRPPQGRRVRSMLSSRFILRKAAHDVEKEAPGRRRPDRRSAVRMQIPGDGTARRCGSGRAERSGRAGRHRSECCRRSAAAARSR